MDFMVIWGFEFFERFVARGGTIVQHTSFKNRNHLHFVVSGVGSSNVLTKPKPIFVSDHDEQQQLVLFAIIKMFFFKEPVFKTMGKSEEFSEDLRRIYIYTS